MKKTLLLLTALLCVSFLYAQNPIQEEDTPLPNEDFFTKSELVVEGISLKMVANYDTKGNRNSDDIYWIHTVRVLKVFKGDQTLVGDIVYITEKGGGLGAENWNSEKYDIEYYTPYIFQKNEVSCAVTRFEPQIFFFVTSDIPDIKDSKYSPFKKYKHFTNRRCLLFENRMYVCGNLIGGLDDLFFQTSEEFYNYMRQFEGFTVPEPAPVSLPEKQPEKIEINDVAIDSAKYEKFEREFIEKGTKIQDNAKVYKKNSVKKKQKNKVYNTITFQYGNHKLMYDASVDKHYITFDILVSSNNSSIYLNDTYMEIKYNSAIFGNKAFVRHYFFCPY